MIDINSLNKNQKTAVSTTEGPVLVVAGAGTGKTRVLTTRIAHLIDNLGCAPGKILAITFTNKAANEMRTRVSNMLNNTVVSWIGTYHGTCLRFLKSEIGILNRNTNFTIIDDEDQRSIVSTIVRDNKIVTPLKSAKLVNIISKIKSSNINIKELFNSSLIQSNLKLLEIYSVEDLKTARLVFGEYQNKLFGLNMVDYDDLIILTHRILRDNLDIRTKWQQKFEYILVDEFQDTNLIQFEILSFLNNPIKNNLFVVGDPDQTIYTWRGAYPDIFKDFLCGFKEAKTIILDLNYRSTKNILAGSNSLIRKNFSRIEKELITDNENGEKIFFCNAISQASESEFICNEIKRLQKEQKHNFNEIVILYRSNFLSRFVEEGLIQHGIPYHIYGGTKFYQRAEIKDLLAYVKLAIDLNDEVSMKRIINVPRRLIGQQTIDHISNYAIGNNMSFTEAFMLCKTRTDLPWSKNSCVGFANLISKINNECKQLKTSEAIEKIMTSINYLEHLKSLENIESRIENIEELKNNILSFENKNPDGTIVDYLQEISLYTDPSEEKLNQNNAVSLMTIHNAKGTEYNVVFVAGVNEGTFPVVRGTTDIAEERRIAYVAMTRARKILYISCSGGYSYIANGEMIPSRFVSEIGMNNLQEKNIAVAKQRIYFSSTGNENNYTGSGVDVGDTVEHVAFGIGVVSKISDQFADIIFQQPHGTKTLIKNHKSLKRIKN